MHSSSLAYETAFAATLVFLNLAVGTAIVTAFKRRPLYTWLLACGFLSLSMYFALFTVSAGTAPIWDRANLALPIREQLVVVLVFMVLWGLCLIGDMVRSGRAKSSTTFRLALLASVALVLSEPIIR